MRRHVALRLARAPPTKDGNAAPASVGVTSFPSLSLRFGSTTGLDRKAQLAYSNEPCLGIDSDAGAVLSCTCATYPPTLLRLRLVLSRTIWESTDSDSVKRCEISLQWPHHGHPELVSSWSQVRLRVVLGPTCVRVCTFYRRTRTTCLTTTAGDDACALQGCRIDWRNVHRNIIRLAQPRPWRHLRMRGPCHHFEDNRHL